MKCARAILSAAGCIDLLYFSILPHKRDDFRKKVIEHKMCVLIFSATLV